MWPKGLALVMFTAFVMFIVRQSAWCAWSRPDGVVLDKQRCYAKGEAIVRVSTPGTQETEGERINRNLAELLQEVRVAETGVQILFAFLLTLPFTQRFGDLAGRDIAAYAVSAVGSAVATVVLVAPVSFHRITFRQGRKPELVAFASLLALVGLTSFGVALVSAAFLIADVVLGLGAGIGFAVLVLGLEAALWFVLPLAKRDDPHKRHLGTGPTA